MFLLSVLSLVLLSITADSVPPAEPVLADDPRPGGGPLHRGVLQGPVAAVAEVRPPLPLLPLVSRMKTCQDNETMVTDLIPGSKYKFRILSASIAGISEPSQESEEVRRVGGRL